MEPGEVKGCIITTLELSIPPLGKDHSSTSQLVHLFLSQLEPVTSEERPCSETTDVTEKAGPCSTHVTERVGSCHQSRILQDSLKEMLQVALTNFQADQKAAVSAVYNSLPTPWSSLARIDDPLSPLPAALCRFSSTLTMLLSVLLKVSGSSTAPLVHTFQQVWRSHLQKELLHIGCNGDMDGWSCCLATMGACLVVTEVGAVLADLTVGEVNGAWLQGGGFAQFAGLDNQLPSLLRKECQKWECLEELGGNEGLAATGGDGLILKSVQVLVDTLATMATIARGCGHQHIMDNTIECAMRLMNQSWQHILKLSDGVPEHLPISVCYSAISSLFHLHGFLERLSLCPSERWSCDSLLVTLGEQITAVQERAVQYHIQLSTTCLLQDSDGGDWQSNHAFHEGEHSSYTIQMWAYHIRGLLHDLCTYLPLECHLLRDRILVRVLEACLSHLASRYSAISPSPKRAGLVLADVAVVLSCVNSVLPCLHSVHDSSPHLQAVHASCNHLLLVAAVVACSLHQLQAALAWAVRRKGGGNVVESGDKTVKSVWKEDGGRAWGNQEWLTFVARYQKYYVLQQQQQLAPPPPSPPSVPRGLLLPHHASQYGALLQALLRNGGALCKELSAISKDVAAHVLTVLSECPHSVWALTATCCALARRETEGHLSDVLLIEQLLQRHFGKILQSHLLTKAASFYSNSRQGAQIWCDSLLEGLLEELQDQVPRPLHALLFYMGGMMHPTAGTPAQGMAKVLANILSGCALATDCSHPAHPLIQPALNCIRYILDPDAPPPFNTSLSELIKGTAGKQGELLDAIVEPSLLGSNPSKSEPSTLAREELLLCSFEEHDVAAQVMTSHEEILPALDAVHAALRQWQLGAAYQQGYDSTNKFNPSKEYTNVAILGAQEEMMLSQQKLMALASSVDFPGILENGLFSNALQLVTTVRWEWQVGVASLLTPDEKSLVAVINQQMSLLSH